MIFFPHEASERHIFFFFMASAGSAGGAAAVSLISLDLRFCFGLFLTHVRCN